MSEIMGRFVGSVRSKLYLVVIPYQVIFRNYIIVVKRRQVQLKKDIESVKFTMKFGQQIWMIYHKTLEKVSKVIFRNYIIVVKKAIDQLKKRH